jgi:hypothetical protein
MPGRRRHERIRRLRTGGYHLAIPHGERELLRQLPGQLLELLGTDDPALERLSPPAYGDDDARSAEYAAMVRKDLLAQRRGSLQVLEATVDAEELDEEQAGAWLTALNDLRLVLGTRLDITEDMEDRPVAADEHTAAAYEVYRYLTFLQAQLVDALSAGLAAVPRQGGGT